MKVQKLSSFLASKLDVVDPENSLPVIVRFKADPKNLKVLTRSLPVERHFALTPSACMHCTKEEISKLTHDGRVEKIWYDLPVKTCLDVSVPKIGAPQVWQEGPTGKGISVAVIDTGIDPSHPDLGGRIIARHDVTGEGLEDRNGHGTHVAGIIAGGGSKYRGVAPDANLLSVKVLKGDGSGVMSDVMAGIEWAVSQGVQVINLSLGTYDSDDGSDALSQTADAAVDKGIVLCVAAGNDGPRGSSINSPGCARKVITIGASTDDDLAADFSSRGPTGDGREKPDVMFPGYGIISCRAKGSSMGRVIDDLYTEASGTSMATPHASGAVALLLQAKPGLNPSQVKQLFQSTAKNLGLSTNIQGSGRADLLAAFKGNPSQSLPVLPVPGFPPVGRLGCLPLPYFLAPKPSK